LPETKGKALADREKANENCRENERDEEDLAMMERRNGRGKDY